MAILYNEEKGMLLEKRTDTGEWCTPGGAIELGENIMPTQIGYIKKFVEEQVKE